MLDLAKKRSLLGCARQNAWPICWDEKRLLTRRRNCFYQRSISTRTRGASERWGNGQLYYQARQYHEAAQIWRTEALAQGRLELWRWVLMAEALGAAPLETQENRRKHLEEALNSAFSDERYIDAQNNLGIVLKNRTAAQYSRAEQLLNWDVNACASYQQARQEEEADQESGWVHAISVFTNIADWLDDIAQDYLEYSQLLRNTMGWNDLRERAGNLRKRQASRVGVASLVDRTEKQPSHRSQAASERFGERFATRPDNPALLDYCLNIDEIFSGAQTRPCECMNKARRS
jgi:hypothetical protein